MASVKDLKKRIGTVKNTQQTTRAMKMVSAAKLRRAQEAITNQRPYAKRLKGLIQFLASSLDVPVESPMLKREGAAAEGKKRVLLVVFTSDRGLCGGFNGNIIKATQKYLLAHQADEEITLSFHGRRGFDFFKSRKVKLGTNYAELTGKVTFQKAKKLSASLVEAYTSGQYDEVKVIYNEFKNAVSQTVNVETFLPLSPPSAGASTGEGAADRIYIVKPDPKTVFLELLDKHFPVQAFRVMLDSQASEHGARMSAMENATKNAGEMIRKLSLEYNKQRQANITKELLEIISGSESQKSAG